MAFHAMERLGVARMEDVGVPRGGCRSSSPPSRRSPRTRANDRHVRSRRRRQSPPEHHPDRDDPNGEAKLHRATDALYRAAVALGGTVTAELSDRRVARRDYLVLQRAMAPVAMMRAIKTAPDPLGILNPGKVPLTAEPLGASNRGLVKVSSSRQSGPSQDRLIGLASTWAASSGRSGGQRPTEARQDSDEMESAGRRRAAGRRCRSSRAGGVGRTRRQSRLVASVPDRDGSDRRHGRHRRRQRQSRPGNDLGPELRNCPVRRGIQRQRGRWQRDLVRDRRQGQGRRRRQEGRRPGGCRHELAPA